MIYDFVKNNEKYLIATGGKGGLGNVRFKSSTNRAPKSGCMGSWGPKEIDKKTNEPYGLNFPVITIRDMVKAQEALLDHLGIEN